MFINKKVINNKTYLLQYFDCRRFICAGTELAFFYREGKASFAFGKVESPLAKHFRRRRKKLAAGEHFFVSKRHRCSWNRVPQDVYLI